MKYLWIITVISLGLYACGSGNAKQETATKQFSTPVAYNDYIVEIQTTIINSNLKLVAALDGDDPGAVKATNNDLIKAIEKANAGISKLECYESNCELRDAAKDLFMFYEEMAKNELKELIGIIAMGKDEMTAKDISRMNELIAAIDYEEARLDAEFEIAQNNFAEQYHISLVENKIQK